MFEVVGVPVPVLAEVVDDELPVLEEDVVGDVLPVLAEVVVPLLVLDAELVGDVLVEAIVVLTSCEYPLSFAKMS